MKEVVSWLRFGTKLNCRYIAACGEGADITEKKIEGLLGGQKAMTYEAGVTLEFRWYFAMIHIVGL